MKFRFLMTAMLATAFCVTPAWAAWHGPEQQDEGIVPDSKTVKPSSYSVTLSILAAPGYTTGPCTGGKGLADIYRSGSCDCYTYTGTATGSAGTGAVTVYETDDYGDGNSAYEAGCDPAYGDIEVDGSKDKESIAFTGADCGSNFTVSGFLNGGCFLYTTSVFTGGGAVAQCGGNYSTEKNQKFTIKGTALK
jgi:hypothetical protein